MVGAVHLLSLDSFIWALQQLRILKKNSECALSYVEFQSWYLECDKFRLFVIWITISYKCVCPKESCCYMTVTQRASLSTWGWSSFCSYLHFSVCLIVPCSSLPVSRVNPIECRSLLQGANAKLYRQNQKLSQPLGKHLRRLYHQLCLFPKERDWRRLL